MSGRYVVMGVAGAGKSVVGAALAAALNVPFVEGDSFHPPENVQRMAAGIPLTDADRLGWLQSLAEQLRAARRENRGVVISCSALKRAYRDLLRGDQPLDDPNGVQFVFLDGSRELLHERLASREGHFMPAVLLESQLAALEAPRPDEEAWRFDVRESPDDIVRAIVARCARA